MDTYFGRTVHGHIVRTYDHLTKLTLLATPLMQQMAQQALLKSCDGAM